MSATGSEHRLPGWRPWPGGGRPGSGAGFTLLETLLVVLLLGLMATLTAVSVQRGLVGARGQAAAVELVSALRRTRMQAMMAGRAVDFQLELAAPDYRIGTGEIQRLPPGLELAIRYAHDLTPLSTGTMGVIRFFPDGSSSGGRITVRQGGRQWQLDVSWLTGAAGLRAEEAEH
ncbi:GspH/FimT family protein [Frateuria aurantia]